MICSAVVIVAATLAIERGSIANCNRRAEMVEKVAANTEGDVIVLGSTQSP